ncbi:MAG: helix-turn-helix transcriptional regulator [Chloroflexaceae bacterium]|nr:helix-turn-helix transcriptional regulator [Chloroflexaceae bacterium]
MRNITAREVKRFGEKLKTLRTSRGMSVRDLASAMGAARSTISSVETSRMQPTIDFAYKVATYFQISTDDLLDDTREVMAS